MSAGLLQAGIVGVQVGVELGRLAIVVERVSAVRAAHVGAGLQASATFGRHRH